MLQSMKTSQNKEVQVDVALYIQAIAAPGERNHVLCNLYFLDYNTVLHP